MLTEVWICEAHGAGFRWRSVGGSKKPRQRLTLPGTSYDATDYPKDTVVTLMHGARRPG